MGKVALIALFLVCTSAVAMADQTSPVQPAPQAATPAKTASASDKEQVTVIAPPQEARLQETCRYGIHNGEPVKVCETNAQREFNRQLTHRDVYQMQQKALTSNSFNFP
jgi:hypothetical protein